MYEVIFSGFDFADFWSENIGLLRGARFLCVYFVCGIGAAGQSDGMSGDLPIPTFLLRKFSVTLLHGS